MRGRADYEAEVRSLADAAKAMAADGASDESIARTLVARRNDLKIRHREGLPPMLLAEIERRNMDRYGDPIGPTAERQYRLYGSWDAVIAAACRPAQLSKRG